MDWDVRWLHEVDSTNRYTLDEARAGAAEGLVVAARHQTAGRGRYGRSWVAPPGTSLLVSVLLRPDVGAERLHLVPASVALAGADAVEAVAGFRPEVKWPNDLLFGDKKLAGVLTEVDGTAVVVGLGLNLNWPDELPPELSGIAVSANHVAGHPVDAEAVLAELLEGIEARYGRWDAVGGELRRYCVTVGRKVRVELPGETLQGMAVDLTDDGHLVVESSAGQRVVTAGDVIHLRT